MKKLLAILAVLVLIFAFVGCSSNDVNNETSSEEPAQNADATTEQPADKDATTTTEDAQKPEDNSPITIGMTWAIKAVEPTTGGTPWSLTSCGISESVYRQDAQGKLVSRFVKELNQVDELTWDITLNEGVKFSDGSDVNAEAFATSMNQVMEENSLSNATAGKIAFTATGDYTVKAVTERPTMVLDSVLCEWTNIIFKDLGDKNYVFTGPYVIANLDSGVSLSLEPNKYYPNADKRGEVTLKAFKDVSAMKMAIESGKIDMAFTITPEVANMLSGSGSVTVKNIEAGYQYFAPINMKGILSDKKLREALNLALNREDYITALGGGHYPTGIFAGYNSFAGKVKVEFDVEKANALLDEAGYKLNADKLREKDGKVLDLHIVTYASRPDLSVIMQVMATQLKAVGIKTHTEIVENIGQTLKEGNYDVALYAQHTSPTGNPAFFLNQFFRTDGSKNMMGYSSKEFDAVLDKMGDKKLGSEMDELAQQAQEILYKDLPALYLDDPQWYVGLSERLSGYTPYCGDYYIINDQLFVK